MAVVRARSSPPYALIVFVFLTVIFLGLTIWFSIRMGDAEKQATVAKADLAKVKAANDQSFYNSLMKGPNVTGSALSQASAQMTRLKSVIEPGGESKSGDEVAQDAARALSDIGKTDGKLVPVLQNMNNDLNAANAQAASLRTQIKSLEDQAGQAAQANTKAAEAAQAQINQLKEQLTASTNVGSDQRKANEDAMKSFQDQVTKLKEDAEAKGREEFLKRQTLETDLAKANETIKTLRNQLQGQKTALTEALQPAGKIVRAPVGTGEVYIDLGRRDKIVQGMTFSVHDPRIGVRGKIEENPGQNILAADTEAAGKGGIEVIQVGETESLCRIEKVNKNAIIQVGDLISNPVYQNTRNRKTHFRVIGDFDLDGDGVATAGERDRVIQMITAWGGTIDDSVTPQTDFLVAGTPPSVPNKPVQSTPGGVAEQRAKELSSYNDEIVEAKRSSVPILNVNRFLAMIGYYNTSIVR
jgi:hypothetical protein